MSRFFLTDRLLIRPIQVSDISDIIDMDRDPDVSKLSSIDFGTRVHIPESAQRKKLKKLAQADPRVNFRWIISGKPDNKFLGCISIENTDNISPHCLTYRLVKSEWNKGIISEALPPVLDFLFNKIKLWSVTAIVHENNAPSLRVLKKIGFKKEALLVGNLHSSRLISLDNTISNIVTPQRVAREEIITAIYHIYRLHNRIIEF